MKDMPIRVLVWDENGAQIPKAIYPQGIRGAIVATLREFGGAEFAVRAAHQDEPDHGLSADALSQTDVLIWWGHSRHADVSDAVAARVVERVLKKGLGLVALHSAHYSKPFTGVLGCTGHLKGGWAEDDKPEEIRVCAPQHPIAQGIHDFVLAKEEMYGAPFDVPPPTAVVFQSYFPATKRYFPSGLCWSVGTGIDAAFRSGAGQAAHQGEGIGRVFYFRPGHETVATYLNSDVQRILVNAARWAAGRA